MLISRMKYCWVPLLLLSGFLGSQNTVFAKDGQLAATSQATIGIYVYVPPRAQVRTLDNTVQTSPLSVPANGQSAHCLNTSGVQGVAVRNTSTESLTINGKRLGKNGMQHLQLGNAACAGGAHFIMSNDASSNSKMANMLIEPV